MECLNLIFVALQQAVYCTSNDKSLNGHQKFFSLALNALDCLRLGDLIHLQTTYWQKPAAAKCPK